jgi:molecular chaperone GrpE
MSGTEQQQPRQSAADQPAIEPEGTADGFTEAETQSDLPAGALAAANAKADEYLAGWKRAAADYANLQKDMARQREEMAKYACGNLLMGLLPALDGFRDATAHAPSPNADGSYDSGAVAKWMAGMGLVRGNFETVLRNAGVTAIDETGVTFDPSCHEAVMMEKPEKPELSGQVLKVLQAGYRLHDRVLRAAKVVVAE